MIGIICHDAGAACILAAFALESQNDFAFHLEGPALDIFNQIYGEVESQSIDDLFNSVNAIYIGTSTNSDIEFLAMKRARKLNIKVTAFIDHWVKYKERFERDGFLIFPDEIVVSDPFANQLIKHIAPGVKISEIENPYIKLLKRQAVTFRGKNGILKKGRALWLSDPFDGVNNPFIQLPGEEQEMPFSEIEAFKFFAEKVKVRFPKTEELVIRPHPSEELEKFDKYFMVSEIRVTVSMESNLLLDILSSEIVGGVSTMALYIAQSLGANCFTSIPDSKFKSLDAFKLIGGI